MPKKFIKRARTKNNGMLGFVVSSRVDRSSKKRVLRERPNADFRRVIAQNIHQLEKFLGTRLSRDSKGNIMGILGGGMWGIILQLENGNVLKVTTDITEPANALFWKNAQRRKPEIQQATCRVYNICKIKDKHKQVFGVIEREAVDVNERLPVAVTEGLEVFIDNFLAFCNEDGTDPQAEKDFLGLAREGLNFFEDCAPALRETLIYAWNRGIPQIDLFSDNVGVRFERVSKYSASGDIVILDFGLNVNNCWKTLRQNWSGKRLRILNRLKPYDKKIKVLG